ncbi:SDR family oxidoreductase [Parasphingorhabdus sp.]|uniref:SDR family oxidoreductase n=1 Tax=Parasphingorhabdus sp. TaxID=2709688 RepID=UPI003A9147D5
MNNHLDGRVALVTGASSGIGAAAARSLAAAGVEPVVAARRASKLDALVGEIADGGGKASVVVGDVSREEDAFRMVEETVERHGRIDILVNSAGMIDAGGLESLAIDRWRRVIEVNLMGTIYTCKAALPQMKAQREGDIINISSTAGRRAAGLMGAYSTSKFGLTGFTEGLRQEMGSYGVRVSIVEPGATETDVAEAISDPVMRDAMRNHVSRNGVLQPSDIADAISFIVSLPRRANVSQILIRPTDDTAAM